ncbi:TPA: DUF2971 domain-containing protein [Vibrio cholerae]|nr:DUF2971 domain-containing protein [Vibrio cholerae]
MSMFRLDIADEGVSDSTIIYRYYSFEAFVNLIEMEALTFAKVSTWEDPWENILSNYDLNFDGKVSAPLYSADQYFFGQCWTLKEESDAMWRIYSPNKCGVKVSSTVGQLRKLTGVRRVGVSKVRYYKDLQELMDWVNQDNSWGFTARYKRRDFSHEEEIRVLVHPQYSTSEDFHDNTHVNLTLPISEFLDQVQIDPRAPAWVENMIKSYCERMLPNTNVIKSELYTAQLDGKFVRKYEFSEKPMSWKELANKNQSSKEL